MWKMQPFARVASSFLIIHQISNILLFRFIALIFTNAFSFFFVFFGTFTKYKSLEFLLILPAAVCIMQHPPYQNDCAIFNSVNRPVNSTYKTNVLTKFLAFLASC